MVSWNEQLNSTATSRVSRGINTEDIIGEPSLMDSTTVDRLGVQSKRDRKLLAKWIID